MTLAPEADALADLLRSLRPYLDDIVFIGGWVHALLLWEEDPGARPLRTTDVDVALPPRLPSEGRAPLLELIRAAGFSVEGHLCPGSNERAPSSQGPGLHLSDARARGRGTAAE